MKQKYFKYVLTVAISIFFVSCYEVNEEIEINANINQPKKKNHQCTPSQ